MPRKAQLDAFHWHEALDRAMLAFEFFNERVERHPAVQATQDLKRQAEAISRQMFQLYQALGEKTSEKGPRGQAD